MSKLGMGMWSVAVGLLVTVVIVSRLRRAAIPTRIRAAPRLFHHTHQSVVPRLGGIALAVAFIAVFLGAMGLTQRGLTERHEWVILMGSLAMLGLGLWDDFRPLGAKVKLLGQILVATGIYLCGIQIQGVGNPFSHTVIPLGALSYFATVFWLVALTNLINLIDGIDGLAGGVAFMLMCLLAYMGFATQPFAFVVAAGMAGALVGFMAFNFPPAKIYLGDGGAYFLGTLIGLLSIENSQKGTVAAALVAPLFALALPIADTTLAIVRRGMKGLPIFRPDRAHIHHKLMAAGLSRQRTVLTLYALSVVCGVAALGVFWSQGRLVPILFGFMFLALLVCAGSLRLCRDWFTTGWLRETTRDLRKDIRYALCLGRWLELEAERCATLEDLYRNFQFLLCKLGFHEARVILTQGARGWVCPEGNSAVGEGQRGRQELRLGNMTAIEFTAHGQGMSSRRFGHLCELAAEAWMNAVRHWHAIHGRPIILDASNEAAGKAHVPAVEATTDA